jgi:hypothetical protein
MDSYAFYYVYLGKLWWEISYWIPYLAMAGHQSKAIVVPRNRMNLYPITEFDHFISVDNILSQDEIAAAQACHFDESPRTYRNIIHHIQDNEPISKICLPSSRLQYCADRNLRRYTPYITSKYVPPNPPYNIIIAKKLPGWSADHWMRLQGALETAARIPAFILGDPRELSAIGITESPSFSMAENLSFDLFLAMFDRICFCVAPAHGPATCALIYKTCIPILIGPPQFRLRYTEIFNLKRHDVLYIDHIEPSFVISQVVAEVKNPKWLRRIAKHTQDATIHHKIATTTRTEKPSPDSPIPSWQKCLEENQIQIQLKPKSHHRRLTLSAFEK